MKPTIEFLTRTFRRFNSEIFSDELPQIFLQIGHARQAVGKMIFRRHVEADGSISRTPEKIMISDYYDYEQSELEDILIHEMIHYNIAYRGIVDTSPHGEVFTRMMQEINIRHRRNIEVRSTLKSAKEYPETEILAKPKFIVVCEMTDGRTLFAAVARTRIGQISRQLTDWKSVKDFSFRICFSPIISSYPAVRSAKLYHISPRELEMVMQDSVPLKVSFG